MHTLLNKDLAFTKTTISEPELVRLISQERASIDKAVRYYNSSGRAVDGSHFLTRLVHSFIYSAMDDYSSVFSSVSDVRNEPAHSVGITTSINTGTPLQSVFYPGCVEYMVSSSDMTYRDTFNVTDRNWEDIVPVKTLYQPYRLLGSHYPSGFGDGHRFACVAIDVPALAVMHSGWAKRNAKRPVGEKESVEQFIGSYVLPNMLHSQYNTTLINMLAVSANMESGHFYNVPLSMHVTSYAEKIEQLMGNLGRRLIDSGVSPEDILDNVPAINPIETMLNVVPRISDSDTYANYTVRFLSNLPYVMVGLTLAKNYSDLTSYRNKVKRIIRKEKNRGTIRRIDSREQRHRVEDMYSRIKFILDI